MITELVVAMLACARIGAVHSIIFGGYSAESQSSRILDAKAKVLITADGVWRGKKLIHLLEISAEAMTMAKEKGHTVDANFVVCHLPRLNETAPDYDKTINNLFDESRDVWWHDVMKTASEDGNHLSSNCKRIIYVNFNVLRRSGMDGCGRPLVYVIHFWFDRRAERCFAHLRRLHALCGYHL